MTGPGESVRLLGPNADTLTHTLGALDRFDLVLFGGFGVMVRVGMAHRPTSDVDGLFDNPNDDTPSVLVRSGIATKAPPRQRVVVNGIEVDVVDTAALPTDVDELPDDGRLFVCAHRWAYETAVPVRIISDTAAVNVPVATATALVATKACALRYATTERRASKRTSDLQDLFLLASLYPNVAAGLFAAPWGLGAQVGAALRADLEPFDATVNLIQRADPRIDPNDVVDVLGALLAALP